MRQGKSNGRMTRRNFLKTSAALGASAAVGGLLGGMYPRRAMAAKRYEGHTLNVFTYAGTTGEVVQNYLKPRFEKETGAKMSIDLGWWDSIPKLKASPPGQDAFQQYRLLPL